MSDKTCVRCLHKHVSHGSYVAGPYPGDQFGTFAGIGNGACGIDGCECPSFEYHKGGCCPSCEQDGEEFEDSCCCEGLDR